MFSALGKGKQEGGIRGWGKECLSSDNNDAIGQWVEIIIALNTILATWKINSKKKIQFKAAYYSLGENFQ